MHVVSQRAWGLRLRGVAETRDQAPLCVLPSARVHSPQFRNPIEEVARTATELQGMIVQEWKDHKRVWEKRWNHYQRIQWDSSQIEANITLVLQGKEPRAAIHPKATPLQLPASGERTLAAKAGG